MKRFTAVRSVAPEANETGLPWLPTWKGVYLVVIIHFVLWVTLLVALTVFFS
jgi:hypothetical protein